MKLQLFLQLFLSSILTLSLIHPVGVAAEESAISFELVDTKSETKSDKKKAQKKAKNKNKAKKKKKKKNKKKKKSKKNKSKVKLQGVLMLDMDHYGDFYEEKNDNSNLETQIRRAQLALRYRSKADWRAKLKFSFDDEKNDIDISDAYIKYQHWDFGDLSVGKMKEPFGLERLTGSTQNAFIERTMISTDIAPGRSYGLMLDKAKSNYSWAVGIFQQEKDDTNDDRPMALTGRVSYAPVNKRKQTVHLGVAYSYRDWNENSYQIRSNGEVYSADDTIRSPILSAVDKEKRSGLEALWRYRSLTLQSEYMKTKVEHQDSENYEFQGYYVQASYYITGEVPRYKGGKISRTKPRIKKGTIEVVARYSELDVKDLDLGAKASVTSVGINYYFSKQTRFMFNYLNPDIEGQTLPGHLDPSGEAFAFRLQHLFES